MRKYDVAFTLAVVKVYSAYEFLRESGLERKTSHKTYSIQFKLDASHYKLRTEEPCLDVPLA